MTTQHFFLTREKQLTPVELISATPYKRKAKLVDAQNQEKLINIHPHGVAWGNMYPRLFEAVNKPEHVFVYKGRCLVNTFLGNDADKMAIPTELEYRFQPFLTHVIDSIHAKENVLLTGGTGVGKTTHILQLAARIAQPVSRINFNGETRMSDLIGKMKALDGGTVWIDGVIPSAMRKGYWLLLDEIDFADPAVLSLLHPVLEADPSLTLKENHGEIIKPHPNFRVFGTANSIGAMASFSGNYGGTNQMNEAFLDRWQVLLVDNLPEKEEIKVVKAEVKGLSTSTIKKMVGFANKARKQDLEGVNYNGSSFSTRKILSWAKKTALHRSPILGAKISWLDKMPQEDQEAMNRILMTHFGSGGGRKKNMRKLSQGVSLMKRRGRPKSTNI